MIWDISRNDFTCWGRDTMAAIMQATFWNACINFDKKKNSLKFVLWGPINNISTLVQKMAWYRLDDTPLSEPMTVSFHTHICVTRPQWINYIMRIIYGWPFYCVDASMKLIQWRHTSSMVSPITPILNCLFSSLSRIATKETSTLRITGSAWV